MANTMSICPRRIARTRPARKIRDISLDADVEDQPHQELAANFRLVKSIGRAPGS